MSDPERRRPLEGWPEGARAGARSGGRLLVAAMSVIAVVAVVRQARAGSTWVMLQRTPGAGPFAQEVVHRAQGELVADGFDVQVVEGPAPANRLAAVKQAGHVQGAKVAAGVFVEGDDASIDLVLVDERTGRTLERRLSAGSRGEASGAPGDESPDVPAIVLARRTVDLLRSSLLAFLVEAIKAAPVLPPPVPPPAPPSLAPAPRPVTRPPRWAVEAGLAVVSSFQGVGPSVLPMARARYGSRIFGARITGAWLGTQPRVSRPEGSATVEQGMALVEATARPWSTGWFRPGMSVGLGSYYVAVDGSGSGSFNGRRDHSFVVAADVGAAAGARLDSQLEFLLEVHALLAIPAVTVRFASEDVARVGRPTIMMTATLAGWF